MDIKFNEKGEKMSEKNILSIMVDDHKLIEKLLDNLERELDKLIRKLKTI